MPVAKRAAVHLKAVGAIILSSRVAATMTTKMNTMRRSIQVAVAASVMNKIIFPNSLEVATPTAAGSTQAAAMTSRFLLHSNCIANKLNTVY